MRRPLTAGALALFTAAWLAVAGVVYAGNSTAPTPHGLKAFEPAGVTVYTSSTTATLRAATYEVDAVGGGSGGGGGGSALNSGGVSTQVGGGGGGCGMWAERLVSLTAATSITITIGTGGNGGNGGAANGNAGTAGSAGTDTTVTGLGISGSLVGKGATNGGLKGGANSTATAAGGNYGQLTGSNTSVIVPCEGGTGTSSKGQSGAAGIGFSGGAGGGGSNATSSFGGSGGTAGLPNGQGGAVTATQTGTVNGGNGANAAANSGAGGGGGGGGAPTGTGGTGGTGGSGEVMIVQYTVTPPTGGTFAATTSAATNLGSTGATLNGTVTCSAAGSTAVTFFRYRQVGVANWPNTTTNVGLACTGSGQSQSANVLSGLTPSTNYEYQACGSPANGGNGCFGPDGTGGTTQTFTTQSAANPPANVTLPTISGTAKQGFTLTETNGAWTNNPTSYSYQWQDCDASGANCVNITGATNQTYALVAADVSHTIRVQESATNAYGTGGPVTSTQTASVTSSGPITGASTATCTGSCGAVVNTGYTLLNVSDDNGGTETRYYNVARPTNLNPSPSNLAPAVLVFYGATQCGYANAGEWTKLAPTEKVVVINMEAINWGGGCNWNKKWVNTSSGPAVPDDEPYVTRVIQDITACPASGAQPNQCIDPQRIYAVGTSSGGNLAGDIACDPTNSPYFRGVQIDSSSFQLYPNTITSPPDCPSTNKNLFMMQVMSNYDQTNATAPHPSPAYCNILTSLHLDINSGLYCPVTPNNGQHFYNWAATHLSCTGSLVSDRIGSATNTGGDADAAPFRYRIGPPCSFATGSNAAVEAIATINGGHEWFCQDSDSLASNNACSTMPDPPGLCASSCLGGVNNVPWTDGVSIEQEFMTFVDNGQSG